MDFLEKLNYLMEKNNLNKSSLSKACNIPYTTIDGWYKKGYEGLKLTTLRKLADYFGTTLDFWASEQEDSERLTKGTEPRNEFIVLNNRLKEIRRTLHMTQKELGDVLGITNGAVSDIEKGKAALTERNISLICEKLNIDKDWLKSGTGDMFLPELPEDEFSKILSEIEESNDDFIKNFLKIYWQLDENGKKVIKCFAKTLAENQE